MLKVSVGIQKNDKPLPTTLIKEFDDWEVALDNVKDIVWAAGHAKDGEVISVLITKEN